MSIFQSFQTGLAMGQQQRKERDRDTARKSAADAFKAGNYEMAPTALMEVGDFEAADAYTRAGDRATAEQRRKTYGETFKTGGWTGLGEMAAGQGDFETAGYAQGQARAKTLQDWQDHDRKITVQKQGVEFLGNAAKQLISVPEPDRLTKAMEYIEQSAFAGNQQIIGAIQQAAADGRITDEELEKFQGWTLTYAQELEGQRWQKSFDQNVIDSQRNYDLGLGNLSVSRMNAETSRMGVNNDAEARRAEAAQQTGGIAPALSGLPAGVQSAIVTKELTGLDTSEEAVGKARNAANIARSFMADAEGYGSLGGGPLADIGQAASQKTAQLKGHTARMIPMMRSPGEGEMTDSDARRYELSVVSINKGRAANQSVVDDLERFEANEVARDKFLREWQAQNGYGSVSQAKLIWQQYADAEPIFDPETGKPRQRRTIYDYLSGDTQGATNDLTAMSDAEIKAALGIQ